MEDRRSLGVRSSCVGTKNQNELCDLYNFISLATDFDRTNFGDGLVFLFLTQTWGSAQSLGLRTRRARASEKAQVVPKVARGWAEITVVAVASDKKKGPPAAKQLQGLPHKRKVWDGKNIRVRSN